MSALVATRPSSEAGLKSIAERRKESFIHFLSRRQATVVEVSLPSYVAAMTDSVDYDNTLDGAGVLVNAIMKTGCDTVMPHLMESIRLRGFTTPIGCCVTTCDENGQFRLMQQNGHHRLLAAWLLGQRFIRVYVQELDDDIDFENTSGASTNARWYSGTRGVPRARAKWMPLLSSVQDVMYALHVDDRVNLVPHLYGLAGRNEPLMASVMDSGREQREQAAHQVVSSLLLPS